MPGVGVGQFGNPRDTTDAAVGVSNGQALAIVGSGLGSKSRALSPWVDDHGQAGFGIPDPQWDHVAPKGGSPSGSTMQNQATNFTLPGGETPGPPDPYVSAIAVGNHNYSGGNDGAWLAFLSKVIVAPTFPFCLYASYWELIPPSWNYTGGAGAWNIKQTAYGAQTGIGDCIYMGVSPQIADNTHPTYTVTLNDNNNNVSTIEDPDRNGKTPTVPGNWGTMPSLWYAGGSGGLNGTWVLREVEMCLDTVTGVSGIGYWNVFFNGASNLNYAGRTDNYASLNTNRGFTIGPCVYSGQYGASNPNNASVSARHIVDITAFGQGGACARALMCNASTIAASTIRVYQTAASWNNTGINVTSFVKGALPTGQKAYAHAKDESGTWHENLQINGQSNGILVN
jgi:hypothetical protein